MAIYRLMDGVAGRPGNGPASASAFSGNYLAATNFQVTQGGLWLTGYWWWCCNTGQQSTAVDFALWELTSGSAGIFVPGSHVTSGTLTAGAWNYTALATPLSLSPNTPYLPEVGYVSSTGFPLTQNQFAGGDPYAAGITNGPLIAPPAGSTLSYAYPQGTFSSSNGADPTAGIANSGFNDSNFWVDLQVTDQAPGGASYRLFPNQPLPPSLIPDTADNFTLGCEFTLSQPCTLDNIWFYSPSGTAQLPTECAIWKVSGQSIVAGTDNASPSWSGAAGSGWVSCPYGNVTLPAGDYKVTVFNGDGSPAIWNDATSNYWATGPGANGITNGPLAAPNTSSATSPGQDTYNLGTPIGYPLSFSAPANGANYWVDVEVTPTVTPNVPPYTASMSSM